MTFLRLTPGHAIAMVAALVLMLATAVDWYSTDIGEEARRIESIQGEPEPGTLSGEVTREITSRASDLAELQEQNAWTAPGVLDRIVLTLLLGSVLLALAAAALRAADRRYAPPLTPSSIAAAVASAAAILVAARIIQEGAVEAGGQVEPGAPLGLVAVAVLAAGAALAARTEREETGRGAQAA